MLSVMQGACSCECHQDGPQWARGSLPELLAARAPASQAVPVGSLTAHCTPLLRVTHLACVPGSSCEDWACRTSCGSIGPGVSAGMAASVALAAGPLAIQ